MIGALDGQRLTLETITIKYQMDRCLMSNRFWAGIQKFEVLKELTIQYSQLNAKTAKHLGVILPKLKALVSIDLEGNPIEAEGALYLLGDSKRLKRWGFRNCCLDRLTEDPEVFDQLLEQLKCQIIYNPDLQIIDLRSVRKSL